MAACKGFLECLLKLLNLLFTLLGLLWWLWDIGIYLFVMYNNATDDDIHSKPSNEGFVQLGRPMLMAVSMSSNDFYDNLRTAWFIYLFIGWCNCLCHILFLVHWCIHTERKWDVVLSSSLTKPGNLRSQLTLIFLLALMVRAANAPAEYDGDDEYISGPRQQRQHLISRQPVPATDVPDTGTTPLDSVLAEMTHGVHE